MIAWAPFVHAAATYDLSHLHPYVCQFVRPAKGDLPERVFEVQIMFSLHCFTRGVQPGDDLGGPLAYSDNRETRIFDFERYERSKQLKEIIEGLPKAPCFHTGQDNFFTIKTLNPATGQEECYEIYFTASRSGTVPRRLNLFIQSAYVRDRYHPNQPSRKKIGFLVVLHNKLAGLPIKVPK